MHTVNKCYLCEAGFSFNTGGTHGFKRGIYMPYTHDNVSMFIARRGMYSVFCSAYRYDSNDIGTANLYGDMYLDFDSAGDFDKAREDAITALSYFKICYKIPEECMHIYFSGSKGVHITVPAVILGVEPSQCLNGVFKHIASSIRTYTANKTVDTKIYDSKRLFRIPNTIHEHTGLYKVPLSPVELKNASEHEIKKMALAPRTVDTVRTTGNVYAMHQFSRAVEEYNIFIRAGMKDRKHARKISFTPPCIQHILDNGAEEGARNITIACLASFYKSYGKTLSETIDAVSEWNSRNVKPTGIRELEKTVSSIFKGTKHFGCTTLKEISECKPGMCRIAKKGR